MKTARYRIEPGETVVLPTGRPTTPTGSDGNKSEALETIDEQSAKLFDLQQLLYADNSRKVLIVLQGMDTSGKDGTIKHVFKMVNPLGVKVANFKRPNDVELEHDYLWRVHRNTPGNGDITIFNRSHYEDVLVVRVHDLVPEKVWKKRYDHIRHFEQMLADEGTGDPRSSSCTSPRRSSVSACRSASTCPAKNWKFEHRDLEERKYWDAYTDAYEEAFVADVHRGRPVVRDPVGPQVVPQPAGLHHPRGDPRVARPELPRARARPRPDRHRR